jgi:hypothetical protein
MATTNEVGRVDHGVGRGSCIRVWRRADDWEQRIDRQHDRYYLDIGVSV